MAKSHGPTAKNYLAFLARFFLDAAADFAAGPPVDPEGSTATCALRFFEALAFRPGSGFAAAAFALAFGLETFKDLPENGLKLIVQGSGKMQCKLIAVLLIYLFYHITLQYSLARDMMLLTRTSILVHSTKMPLSDCLSLSLSGQVPTFFRLGTTLNVDNEGSKPRNRWSFHGTCVLLELQKLVIDSLVAIPLGLNFLYHP